VRRWVLKEQIAAWLLDAAFPLILAFSLGEKEGVLRPAWNSNAAFSHPAAGCLPSGERVSLSPRERAGVRGNGSWRIKRLSGLGVAL
jgi:hypothetical protein